MPNFTGGYRGIDKRLVGGAANLRIVREDVQPKLNRAGGERFAGPCRLFRSHSGNLMFHGARNIHGLNNTARKVAVIPRLEQ